MARARLRGEGGQEMAVELMVLLPVTLFLVLLVAWAGRYTTSRARLADVAGAAARAATLATGPDTGRAAAQRIIDGSSLPQGCAAVTDVIEVRGPADHPDSWRGATVTVTLTCTVRNTVLAGVWTPGTTQLRGRATHPVDPFRGA